MYTHNVPDSTTNQYWLPDSVLSSQINYWLHQFLTHKHPPLAIAPIQSTDHRLGRLLRYEGWHSGQYLSNEPSHILLHFHLPFYNIPLFAHNILPQPPAILAATADMKLMCRDSTPYLDLRSSFPVYRQCSVLYNYKVINVNTRFEF